MDSEERKLLLHSLVGLKNQLIQQGRYTDCVDELIIKIIHAPVRKLRVEMAGRSDVEKLKDESVLKLLQADCPF